MGSTTSGKHKKQVKLKDFVSWFEIPAINFDQAVAFYNHIYGIEMETTSMNEHAMAFFPAEGGVGGAVVSGPGSVPHESGPLVYLTGGKDLNEVLNKVPEAGYFAIFIDCEGNKLALHSNS